MKIDFTLNSTFESNLLVTNIVFKEMIPLKLLQVCFILNNWVKDEPKLRPKISFFKKFNCGIRLTTSDMALKNPNVRMMDF